MPLSAHASRWLVTIIAGPILIWSILAAPPIFFQSIVALVGLVAWWEFFGMMFDRSRWAVLGIGLAGWLLIVVGASYFGSSGWIIAIAVGLVAGFIYCLREFAHEGDAVGLAGRFSLGHLYIGVLLSMAILVFMAPGGRLWILFSILVTFLGDTSAYYVGKKFGRHPLAPRISPKKTLEGLAGNCLGCAVTATVYAVFLLAPPWYEALVLGLLLGVWGTMGDLFESVLKRSVGVKDSGHLLMGHGGILDRVDALLFNLPLIYLFILWRGGVT
jgi:phosphatidate cytidylyltransferase